MTKDIAHHLNIGSRINLPPCVAVAKHMRANGRGPAVKGWRGLSIDHRCMAEKNSIRPGRDDTLKWPPNRHPRIQNLRRFIGQTRKPVKMFRAGIYARGNSIRRILA
jgi:hypothetical protein